MRFFAKSSIFFVGVSLVVTMASAAQQSPWTWLHKKRFSTKEIAENKEKNVIVFSRNAVPAFSQLLFSWNGFRACNGYFSFWAQVRDQKTKKWGSWHKMIDWGTQVQRSYLSTECSKSSYHHVRLEMNKGHLADAFRVKIRAHEGADLSMMKAFSVSLSDFNKFTAEVITPYVTRLPSVLVSRVPKQSQFALDHEDNGVMCSPTSCSMLTGFFVDRVIDPVEFAAGSYDRGLQAYGSWPFNMAHAFEQSEGRILFSTARLNSFNSLYRRLAQGTPVAVSVRGPIEGAPKPYANGHLMVVVGWNARDKKVIVHDPAVEHDAHALRQYPLESFLRAWERSRRLSYIAEPLHKL